MLDVCAALTCRPGRLGAEQVIDETGRSNEVVYTAHFRVTDWSDHAVREVQIIVVRRF